MVKNFLHEKPRALVIASAVIFFILIILGFFSLGVTVGYTKARYSYLWEEHYEQNFGAPQQNIKRGFPGPVGIMNKHFTNGHGLSARVLKIDGNTLVVNDEDNIEKTVQVSNQTLIEKGRALLTLSDVEPNDQLIIIGSPTDQGSITARMIRVFQR